MPSSPAPSMAGFPTPTIQWQHPFTSSFQERFDLLPLKLGRSSPSEPVPVGGAVKKQKQRKFLKWVAKMGKRSNPDP